MTNRQVWRFEVNIGRHEALPIPIGARPIHVGMQRQWPKPPKVVNVWFEVNPAADRKLRTFVVHGTGHPIEEGDVHIGTTQDGEFVWHLYEVLGPLPTEIHSERI